ncbi:MAG: 16S rRNA (cytidine(1402)-2'-O)-methyltransferase [Clostridia bacterium]|nr:16S rRNA (cytidine(1402)-2'-O)-methyltransferase [Clostridia bacterium]MDE7328846.1 16S rRNA (cytidine(1402)-2'-O)-methyltransferase [Clostridia bacterium]
MSKLFLVGTPIGNLSDISLRALETLKSVSAIACEDTRHSLKLLNYYGIKKRLIACHKFNERESVDKIYSLLCEGNDVALITDAGMPAISDPGAILVNGLIEKGAEISVVPGPTALTSAMALSGIVQPVFTFIGFLPAKNKDRNALLSQFKDVKTSLVFYSSPYDVKKDIQYLFELLGERVLHIVRELTKVHEEHITTSLSQGFEGEAKGEYVLIVEAGEEKQEEKPLESIEDQLKQLLDSGVEKKEAIKQVAKRNGLAKDDVYKVAVEIKL